MSSNTPRVSLYKPAGGENVNVTTDINNNLDKIDTNLNFRVAASQTARYAISPYWEGLNVRDTDTGRTWVSNGSSPQSGSWKEIPNSGATFGSNLSMALGTQVNIGASSSTAPLATVVSASGSDNLSVRVTGDTQSRWLVKGDGTNWWGPGGSTAIDTNLYRAGVNLLATDDELQIKGGNLLLGSGGTLSEINSYPSTSVTVANTITETVVASYTIPANDAIAGAVYRLTAWGTASTAATAPTLKISGRIGGVAGAQFGTTNAFTCTASQVNRVWKAEILLVVLTTGVSGTAFGNLEVVESQSVAGTANPVSGMNTRMDGGVSQTMDTTASKDLVLTATWGTASASNTLTCRGFSAMRVA